MDLRQRIRAFATLGSILRHYTSEPPSLLASENVPPACLDILDQAVRDAGSSNPWFTRDQTVLALKWWGELLREEGLTSWLKPYHSHLDKTNQCKKIGIIMAGNIPLVGFHDLLCVLISGNRALVKCSSEDDRLIPSLVHCLASADPQLVLQVEFLPCLIGHIDAVIATGSVNTSRYFEYYYRNLPSVIRTSRTGVAIITGRESVEDLAGLAFDVFSYYGLGCRNVSHIYVQMEYDFSPLIQAFGKYRKVMTHQPYKNNLDYFRSVFLVTECPFIDGGCCILAEDPRPESPVSVLHYTRYTHQDEVIHEILTRRDQIQCIIAHEDLAPDVIRPGKSQYPGLSDYADGIDTISFLCEKLEASGNP